MEFDRVLDSVDNNSDDIVLHRSINNPLGSMKKYALSEPNESSYSKPKLTQRASFDDLDEEEVLHARKGSNVIAPVVTSIEDTSIYKEKKEKPKLKEKIDLKKGRRGEALSSEAAVEFMIKERQAMDAEYARLRDENIKLKEGLLKQQHKAPNAKEVIVEKVVERKIIDPDGFKYKVEAEKLRIENEKLRNMQLQNEQEIMKHKKIAFDAVQHPLFKKNSPLKHEDEDDDSVPQTDVTSTTDSSSAATMAKDNNKLPISSQLQRGATYPTQKSSTTESISTSSKSLGPASVRLTSSKHSEKIISPPQVQAIRRPPADTSKSIASKKNPSSGKLHVQDFSTIPYILWKGGVLWKIPYNGKGLPEKRSVMIKRASKPGTHSKPVKVINKNSSSVQDDAPIVYIVYPPTIIWANPAKFDDISNARELSLYEGAHVVEGYNTSAFWKCKSRGSPLPPQDLCFSVVTSTRSLDLAAESVSEATMWKNAFHMLLVLMSSNQEWALSNLSRTTPTWRHDSLVPPNADKKQKHPKTLRLEEEYLSSSEESEDTILLKNTPNAEELKGKMFQATKDNNYDALDKVLADGVSVNLMENDTYDTPLLIACRENFYKIAQLCLTYGARNDPHPDFGQTALHAAVEGRAYHCAKVLLEAAAPSQADAVITNLRDSKGRTPLHLAVAVGDTKMSSILISHGAKLTSKDNLGQTPVHLCSRAGHKICLSLLLDHDADNTLDEIDTAANTALHYAAENGHLSCVRLLLETAANPHSRNKNNHTPYNLAVARGHHQVSMLLLEYHDIGSQGTHPLPKQRAVSDPIISRNQHMALDIRASSVSPRYDNISTVNAGDVSGLPRPHTYKSAPSPNAIRTNPSGTFRHASGRTQIMEDDIQSAFYHQPMSARVHSQSHM